MENNSKKKAGHLDRRKFIQQAAVLASAFSIVPRHVLGGKGFLAPSDKITLGFIGLGKMGFKLKDYFFTTGEEQIVAACDIYGHKLKSFVQQVDAHYSEDRQKNFKGCQPYTDFRELLADKSIDAVVIATPDHWHASMTVLAAKAGKDIYCEKPLALTIKEGRAMVDAVRKYGRVSQTGSMQRSWGEFRQAVEIIRNGELGELTGINVILGEPPVPYNLPEDPIPNDLDWEFWIGPNEYVHFNKDLNPALDNPVWGRWRDFKGLGGGDMTDWGAHMFDIVQWALDMDHGGPVEIIPPNGKDVPLLTYVYENGVKVTHETIGQKRAVQFKGTEGTLEVERGSLVTTPGFSSKRVYHSTDHYKDFLDAMRKRSKPVADIEIGHRTATVCTLGNIAYELNRPLRWDYKKEKFIKDAAADKLLGRKMKKEWRV